MLISSADLRCAIDVTRNGKHAHASFEVSCTVDIGHGRFSGTNAGVHFLDLDEFVDCLDRFIMDRSLEPTLHGTDGTFLKVSSPGKRNSVGVSFAIGDAFAGIEVPSTFRLEGVFDIEQQKLLSILEGFRALALGT